MSQAIAAVCRIPVVQPESIVAKYINENTSFANQLQNALKSNGKIPETLLTSVILDYLSCKAVKHQGYILDGFPQTIAQAQQLVQQGYFPDKVFILDVDHNAALDRIPGRSYHQASNRVYHSMYNPAPLQHADQLSYSSLDKAPFTHANEKNQLFEANTTAMEAVFKGLVTHVDATQNVETTLAHCMGIVRKELASAPRVMILGPNCSGKTLISKHIAKEMGIAYIHISEQIRLEIASKSALSEDIVACLKQGSMVRTKYYK